MGVTCHRQKTKYNPNNNNVSINTYDSPEDYTLVREQMSNFSCERMYNIYDGWVYSLNFPEDGESGLLSKMRTDGTDYTVYLQVTEDYL